MDTIHIELVIHHRGKFQRERDGKMVFEGGVDIGYNEVSDLYWLEPGKKIDSDLRLLGVDLNSVRMYEAFVANGRKIDVYSEHPISVPEIVEDDAQSTEGSSVQPTSSVAEVQQSRLKREKGESNHWQRIPTGDDNREVYEVKCLPMKVSVHLGRKTCSCEIWKLTSLPCKHACAALAYQNIGAGDFAHN
ncbi:hypothetical protein AHAS_Ahas07G0054600 [Arachis hypogaea]